MIRFFSACRYAIMAAKTITNKSSMVYRRWCPRRGAMTGITFFCGNNMRGMFTGRDNAIMATRTRTNHLSVIKRADQYRLPQIWPHLVAGLAFIRRGNMGIIFP
jgi:hypothetical protein